MCKVPHAEKYKSLSDIKEDLNKWRDILCSWIGRHNIIKMSVLFKLIYKFNAVSIKIPSESFIELDKLILKFV